MSADCPDNRDTKCKTQTKMYKRRNPVGVVYCLATVKYLPANPDKGKSQQYSSCND